MELYGTDPQETSSQAACNYGGAALLVGLGIFWACTGFVLIRESISAEQDNREPFKSKPLPKKAPESESPASVMEKLKKAIHRKEQSAKGDDDKTVAEKIVDNEFTRYYVKKNYKEAVVVGSMIPRDFLVEKTEALGDLQFKNMENIKFKSRITHKIKGGVALVEVEEILDDEKTVNKPDLKPV